MSEDAFEPSFPSYDTYMEDLPYGSPLEDDDVPLNLELSSVPHSQRANKLVNFFDQLQLINLFSSSTFVLCSLCIVISLAY